MTDRCGDGWQPDRKFWLRHLFMPALCVAGLGILLERSSIDLWLADRWFALEGQQWAWRHHWLTYEVIHHYGKQFIIAVGFGLLVLLALGARIERLRRWRKPLLYLLASMALLPAFIAWAKHYSPVPCPWDLQRYGGDAPYRHTLEYSFGLAQSGFCFPAGHASAGFALIAAYFAALPLVRRPGVFLAPGLVVGTVFALGQQARGAHFVSHDLWSLAICWFGALGLFFAFRPDRWGMPEAKCAERSGEAP